MAAIHPFHARFMERLVADKQRGFVQPFMAEWSYQSKRRSRGKTYEDGSPEDFYTFTGPDVLANWMTWIDQVSYPMYFRDERTHALQADSIAADRMVLDSMGLSVSESVLEKVSLSNAQDFSLAHLYPVPERNRIRTVLDFGAGYGRQANLFHRKAGYTYIAVDGIPSSYGLQHHYLKALGADLQDYLDAPDALKVEPGSGKAYHLPTWRLDLVPDASVDLVMTIQVLPELSTPLIKHIAGQFRRILKAGGAWLICDHISIWRPATRLDYDAWLQENGFSLEFKPHIILNEDLHGIPRIYRRTDDKVLASQTMSPEQKRKQLLQDADSLSGGLLRKVARTLKRS